MFGVYGITFKFDVVFRLTSLNVCTSDTIFILILSSINDVGKCLLVSVDLRSRSRSLWVFISETMVQILFAML